MKLWGWWRKDASAEARPERSEPQTLDDLPPKFEDNVEEKRRQQELARPSLSQTLKSISVEDFKALPQVPCFRNAMLTGLGMGAVAGGVMFASRRAVPRTLNWFVGGFAVGAVVSWEQCRFRMARGRRNVRQAQEAWRHKDKDDETK